MQSFRIGDFNSKHLTASLQREYVFIWLEHLFKGIQVLFCLSFRELFY